MSTTMNNFPNSPVSAEPNHNWVDITGDFFESIKYLNLGELLHDEFFGLFEAMSAIEMMDPKMDAGMICNRGNSSVMNFDKAVATGLIEIKDIPFDVQIGIIDETYSCLVSWLGGHSLAQTLFTNIYLHKPHSIEAPTMRVFAIVMHKLIDTIRDFVNRGVVYEEEDFQPMMYGYRLYPDVCPQRTVALLRELEDSLNKMSTNTKSEVDQIKALNLRLKFSRLLYQCFLAFNKIAENPAVGEIQKILVTCSDLVPQIIATIPLGTPVHNGKMVGFDPLINQRLLPPTFPRFTKIRPRCEAYEYLNETLNRLKHVCKITNVTNNYQASLDVFVEMSRYHPCLIARSVMQLVYMPRPHMVLGSVPLVNVLRETARSFIAPPFLCIKHLPGGPVGMLGAPGATSPGAREAVDTFLGHCVRPFAGLIQMLGHNRARQRDRLGHLLEEFAALQDEAERVDVFLHTLSQKFDPPRHHLACFGTWILYYTLRIISMYLLAGFELELYSVHEYYYIYWYLYEFLYAWLISALTRADNFLQEQELLNELQAAQSAQGSKKGEGRGGKKGKMGKGGKKKSRHGAREIIMCQALQNMSGGYFKALLGFSSEAKLPPPPHPEFSSERVRYEHRFQPLAHLVTPPHMQYAEFVDSISHLMSEDTSDSCTSLYIAACKHFHSARTILESIMNPDPQILDLIRIAKTNFIVVKLFATGTQGASNKPPRPVQFDFSAHACYPIFKL